MLRLPLVAAWHGGVEGKIFIVRRALQEHGGWYENFLDPGTDTKPVMDLFTWERDFIGVS
jgi:hypothetical protein